MYHNVEITDNTTAKSKMIRNIYWYSTIVLLSILTILPFYKTYTGNGIIYVSKYVIIVLFTLLLFRLVKDSGINQKIVIIFTSFLFTICTVNILSIDNVINYLTTVSNILMYCFVGFLSVFIFPKISLKRFHSILTMILFITFILVTLPSTFMVKDSFLYTDIGGRLRFLGPFNNANELARFALLGVLIPIRIWSVHKGILKKIFFILMITTNIYLIYLADSRASLVVVLLTGFLLLFIGFYKLIPKEIFISFSLFLVIIVFSAIFFLVNSPTFNYAMDLSKFTSNRAEIWSSMFQTDWVGLVFGSGPMQEHGSHNGYLEILKYFGILGFVTWMSIIILLLFKKANSTLKKMSYANFFGLGVVILFMIYHLVEGSMVSIANLTSIYFWLELSQRNVTEDLYGV